MSLLRVEHLCVYYGAVQALDDVSLVVNTHEIVALLGANGAGKSTLMKALMGLVAIKNGHIFFKEHSLRGKQSYQIVSLGMGLSPEGRQVFADMSVEENLRLGAYDGRMTSQEYHSQREFLFSLFPLLKNRLKQLAGTLSGGEQQMLALSRALISKPQLLLLDEPSLGVAPLLTEQIFRAVKKLPEQGTAVLLAEQNAHLALQIAHRGYVLETGRVVCGAQSQDLLQDNDVRQAYLGG